VNEVKEGINHKSACLPFLVSLFALVFFSAAYFYQSGQHNENARFAQVRSLAEDGELNINRYAGRSADVVIVHGMLFPNKAPGGTLIAAPVWWCLSKILPWVTAKESSLYHFNTYLTTCFVVGFASAALCVLVYLLLELLLKESRAALVLCLAYAFGTIAFPFSTLFFSHQLAAFLAFASFFLLFFLCPRNSPAADSGPTVVISSFCLRHRKFMAFLAGFLIGIGTITEYPLALVAFALTAYVLLERELRKMSSVFVLGVVIGGAPHLYYNISAFADPFLIPYAIYARTADAPFHEHAQGFMGVSLPSLSVLCELLFGLQRGLFVVNPWLILLVPGLFAPLAAKSYRLELLLCLIVVLGFLAFNAGYSPGIVFSGGGASVGPRHIIPMLPFAVLLIAGLLRYWLVRLAFYPLALVSAGIMLMATAVEPRASYNYGNPVVDLFFRNYAASNLALHYDGVFNAELLTPNSVAFNLGKLLGLPGPLQLLPLFVFWFVLFSCLWSAATRRDQSKNIESPSGTQAVDSEPAKSFQVSLVSTRDYFRLSVKVQQVVLASVIIGCYLVVLFLIPVSHALNDTAEGSHLRGLFGTYVADLPWDSCRSQASPKKTAISEKLTRVDEYILFPWEEIPAPINGPFSVKWTGILHLDAYAYYGFATISDDGSCVYIDGNLVVDNWGVHGSKMAEGFVYLDSGTHEIEVRYANEQFLGRMYLLWALPGSDYQPIPSKYLFPRFEDWTVEEKREHK
jgi:hypothetical protein